MNILRRIICYFRGHRNAHPRYEELQGKAKHGILDRTCPYCGVEFKIGYYDVCDGAIIEYWVM